MDDVIRPGHNGVGSNSTQVFSLSSPLELVDWASSFSGLSVSSDLESVEMASSISIAYY